MSVIEFLWSLSFCLIISLLATQLYIVVRNDVRSEIERQEKRRQARR